MTRIRQLVVLSFVPYFSVFIGLYVLSNAWIALIPYHLAILMMIMIHFKEIEKIRFSIQNKTIFILGTISTLLVFPVLYFLWDIIKIPDPELLQTLNQFHLTGGSFLLFIFYLSSVHPVLEEIYWRFIISYKPNKKFNFLFDALFAGYHILVLIYFVKWPLIILSFVLLLGTAITWRMIKEKYQDHLTLFVSHALADFSIMTAILLLSQR